LTKPSQKAIFDVIIKKGDEEEEYGLPLNRESCCGNTL